MFIYYKLERFVLSTSATGLQKVSIHTVLRFWITVFCVSNKGEVQSGLKVPLCTASLRSISANTVHEKNVVDQESVIMMKVLEKVLILYEICHININILKMLSLSLQ
jgi:hypothetical protein